METVHRLLRAAREVLDLTQAQVVEATGVSRRTLIRIETSSHLVNFQTLAQLREYFAQLGLTLVELENGKYWALKFDRKLAPIPQKADGSFQVYEPLPGNVLKAARVTLGVSQAELGLMVSLAHTTIRRLEQSDASVSPEKAYVLQRAFETRGLTFDRPTSRQGWLLKRAADQS